MSLFATGTWIAIGATAAAVGSAATATMTYQGAQQQKQTARSVAKYNADLDIAKAKQIDLDTQANIRSQRAEDKVFASRQQTAYAMAGVLSSGSPLAVAATTAGRMEKRIQQGWQDSLGSQSQLRSAAQMGVMYGEQQAKAYELQSSGAIIGGASNMLSAGAGGIAKYQSAIAGSGGTSKGPDYADIKGDKFGAY